MQSQTFYSNGKLLLTGEYLVIDGAISLAIPTKKGQALTISETEGNSTLLWKSWSSDDQCWLEVEFSLPELSIEKTSDEDKGKWLQQLLLSARELNTAFLVNNKSIESNTKLDFPRDWGLGSSSTLINNVAQWAEVDPFDLHFKVSNGSGYDIACAYTNNPILYTTNNMAQNISPILLDKPFLKNVFFVHLNKKQNSNDAVVSYSQIKQEIDLPECIESVNHITKQFIEANTLKEWEKAMDEHEYLISNILEQETVKEKLFPLYQNSIKSLGAWGGDFIMATGTLEDSNYFIERGYKTVTFIDEMMLKASH